MFHKLLIVGRNQEYYVKLAVGKAKKIFHFQLDTGSQPSWLACKWPTIDEHPPDVIHSYTLQIVVFDLFTKWVVLPEWRIHIGQS